MYCLVFFFFSSRRRHTRWTGDWSSDVCSSDLQAHVVAAAVIREEERTWDDRDATLDGTPRKIGCVPAVGQRQPREEAALRSCPARAPRHVTLKGCEHQLALAPVERSRLHELLVDPAAADVLLEEPLPERSRALVGVLLRR